MYFIFFFTEQRNGTKPLNLEKKIYFSHINFKKQDNKNNNYSPNLNKAKQVIVSSDTADL